MKTELKDYIDQLEIEYSRFGKKEVAVQQKAYMRDQFEYFGMKAPVRREVQQPFLVKEYLPLKEKNRPPFAPERGGRQTSKELTGIN